MNLQVHELNIRPSDALRAHVEQRFHRALARILRQVSVVVVRFADVNGPRGGRDKTCNVQVRLLRGQTVRIRERDICFYRAVDRAARRARRVVRNTLRRRRAGRRYGPRRRTP